MRKFLLLSLSIIFLSACDSETGNPTLKEREDIVLSRSEQQMTEIGNEFAFKLFHEVSNNEKDKNIFISPLSASIALSMTANGAAGNSEEQMKSVLGFKDYALEEMNQYYKKITDGLLKADPSTELGIANSIWVKEGFPLLESFITTNKEVYDAEVRNLDFDLPSAPDIINKWCAGKTNNKIEEVIKVINPQARAFLINALYFKGVWKYQFDKKNTKKDNFNNQNGSKTSVDMMNLEGTINYNTYEEVQIAELPYGNEAFSMIVIVPEDNYTIDHLTKSLNAENWNKWINGLRETELEVKLPKFKLEYEKKFNDELKAMGMEDPFNSKLADFSRMTDKEKLFIGFVQQNTFVEVSEEGTEAAAVTVVGMINTSVGPEPMVIPFHVNRPFIYVIKEKSTGAILFMGRMTNL